MKKPVKLKKDLKSEEPIIPDRHFRHNEPEVDYSMDELDRQNDDDPGLDEIRKEQDDDE